MFNVVDYVLLLKVLCHDLCACIHVFSDIIIQILNMSTVCFWLVNLKNHTQQTIRVWHACFNPVVPCLYIILLL